jgi:hypothetical protein
MQIWLVLAVLWIGINGDHETEAFSQSLLLRRQIPVRCADIGFKALRPSTGLSLQGRISPMMAMNVVALKHEAKIGGLVPTSFQVRM